MEGGNAIWIWGSNCGVKVMEVGDTVAELFVEIEDLL